MADIILRSGKGSNLTPNEVDSNFKNLNDALITLQVSAGAGTVTSVGVNNTIGGVISTSVTSPTTNPVINISVTGSAGYVKSSGTALSTVSTIPFTDTTGTVPVNRGGTNLTSLGSDNTFLSVEGTSLIYRSLTSPDGSINLSFGSTTLDVSVNQSVLDISTMYGVLPVSMGGTGYSASSRQDAINYLTNVSSATTGQILQRNSGGNVSWVTPSTATGTVTSVSLSTTGLSSVFNTSVGTATTTPALNISLVTGTPGYLKSNGTTLGFSSTVPTSDLSGSVAIANGGTGQTTRQAAIDALTDTAGASTNQVLVRNSSSNAAWASSLVLSDVRITTERTITNSTTLSSTDRFVGIDLRGGAFTVTLPVISGLEVGKTFIIKDLYGYASTYNCIISGLPTYFDGSYSFTMNSNFQCVEVMVTNATGAKTWIVKNNSKNT